MNIIQRPTNTTISQRKHGRYNAVDFRARTLWSWAMNRKNLYAMEDGNITSFGYSGDCGNRIELTSGNGRYRHGICHLEAAVVKSGKVVRGQLIGIAGHSGFTIPKGVRGTHSHWVIYDTVKKVYIYPLNLVNAKFRIYTKPEFSLPAIGSKIRLIPRDIRTTFKAGTKRIAGSINVTDDTFIYTIRGYDKKYPNRGLINSRSGGGDGVALALYYTNGKKIEGWITV